MSKVDTTGAVYSKMSAKWSLPRALMGGTAALREAGELYLPRDPKESLEAYRNRLDRSTLFNAFKRTISSMMGKVFSRPVGLGEDVPSKIMEWAENVDLRGRDITEFAKEVFKDGAQVGISYILVDMPVGENVRTQADEKMQGIRPYFVHIRAEDLIGFQTEIINGKRELSQIKFRESVTESDGEYAEKEIEQLRVLWRDRYELHRKDDKGVWQLVKEGAISLGKIPLAVFYAGRTGFMQAEPPLEDLAYLNISHWQSSSDQRHILHVARVPILFGTAIDALDDNGKPVEIGPNRMITSSDPGGKLGYVEHSGEAIGSGRQDLLDIEDRMRVMGLELHTANQTGNATATGRAIDSAEQNSVVSAMAGALEQTLEQALAFMAEWANLGDTGGSVDVNTDFNAFLGERAQEIAALLNTRLAGEISSEAMLHEMKRRGFLSDDYDIEADKILIEEGINNGELGLEE